MTALDDFRRFVTDAESGGQFAAWAKANPGEVARWHAFRDAVLAGGSPAPPPMLTWHGRELVDAARLFVDARPAAVALRVVVAGSPLVGSQLTAQVVQVAA